MGDQISLVDSIMKLSFVAPYLDDTIAMTLYTISVIPLMKLQAVWWKGVFFKPSGKLIVAPILCC